MNRYGLDSGEKFENLSVLECYRALIGSKLWITYRSHFEGSSGPIIYSILGRAGASKTALEPAKTLNQWVPGPFSPG
jgi:hypothetical protein